MPTLIDFKVCEIVVYKNIKWSSVKIIPKKKKNFLINKYSSPKALVDHENNSRIHLQNKQKTVFFQ